MTDKMQFELCACMLSWASQALISVAVARAHLDSPGMAISSKAWLRVAGISGASAVILGTYGAHAFRPKDDHYLSTFETANKYHFIHSLLIGLAPKTRCV